MSLKMVMGQVINKMISNAPFELSKKKKELLDTKGHILVLGGPGSGKTTIALLKSKQIIEEGLSRNRHVLFLSFARATVTRVGQQAKNLINEQVRKQLEINTYHGFSWNILKSHGYLLNGGKKFRLLPPPDAASRLADINPDDHDAEKQRIFENEGLIHFDLFAQLTASLLEQSKSLRSILSSAYPVVILDEFQDTDTDEWRFIQQLAKHSTIIALADLEQRIYEFRGADPARVTQFIKACKPTEFDFGTENNRSNGTDIVQFGNDLLTGKNKGKVYSDVHLKRYPIAMGNGAHLVLKTEIIEAVKRMRKSGNPDWSIGLLVPSKKLMLAVSDFLAARQQLPRTSLPPIYHEVALEMAGPSLSAVMIARLMEKNGSEMNVQHVLLNHLCEHIRGRNGGAAPSKANLELSNAVRGYLATTKLSGKNRKLVVSEALRIATECKALKFSGDPVADWVLVRKLLEGSESDVIRQAGVDAQYLRLLRKGAILGSGLSGLWRDKGHYEGAGALVRAALAQEHFSTTITTWKGINLMTIHKAKGKEFEEVIIYEGMYSGRILRPQSTPKDIDQSRLALRVAVTRAMKRTTIITPIADPCPFVY